RLRLLRIEERDLPIEPTRPLDVDVELVGAVGHQDEEDATAVPRVAHELLDARDRARGGPAVALAVAPEAAIALVDDDDDLAHRLDDREDALEVRLRRADPLAPEVLELDRGEARLLHEGLGDERLAGPHRPGDQDAHRRAGAVALAHVLGDLEQLLLHLVDAADHREVVIGLDELDEAEALALDDLPLAPEDELEHALAPLVFALLRHVRRRRDERSDLLVAHPLGEL